MSVGRFLQQGAAGNAGAGVYVDDVFSTYLYEGTGSAQTITNGIDLDGEGGLVWIKQRNSSSAAAGHAFIDTERGVGKAIASTRTDAEYTTTTSGSDLTSFNSNGFSLGPDQYYYKNQSSGEYCAWTFRKQPGFFDVVTYTGDSNLEQAVAHNLGSTPGCVIVKKTDSTGSWFVWHRKGDFNPSEHRHGFLNLTSDFNNYGGFNNAVDQSTFFTDGIFTVRGDANTSGATYVAYLFAHDAQEFGTDSDESIIKCGSYTGNGSTTGPVIDLGFEPQFLILKNVTTSLNWLMFDTMRGLVTNGNDEYLKPNASDSAGNLDFLSVNSTGFQIDSSYNDLNKSGDTFIYVAIRRPHKPAEEFAATDLFETVTGTGNPAPNFISGFPVDMYFNRKPATSDNWDWSSRLTQGKILRSNLTSAEVTNADFSFDYQNGVMNGGYGSTLQSWMFRRAPGFFDVVTYTGTGSTLVLDHNLGVEPEFMIVKGRTINAGWHTYHKDVGNTKAVPLNSSEAESTSSFYWNNTSPTATQATLGAFSHYNVSNQTGILYLFATVPGISKVGSYSGTGATQTIDCGFSSGARFVLLKGTTQNNRSWFVFDTERGITTTAPTSPFVTLNTTNTQSLSSIIEPDPTGFKIISTGAGTNGSGEDYIFLAIA